MAGELVLKQWSVPGGEVPPEPKIIIIKGRPPGLMAFLMNMIGLDPTTTLEVSDRAVYYTSSSVRGSDTRVIPLQSISSTYYGFRKPIELLVLGLATLPMLIGAVFIVMYFLRKSLALAVVEHSGVISMIEFKSSVIENIAADQNECARVNRIISDLMLRVHNKS